MIRVEITNRQRLLRFPLASLRALARHVLRGEGIGDAEISLAIVDDPAIHQINKQFLQHDEATDVVTFPLSEVGEAAMSGELVVSAETAVRVAKAMGHAAADEMALYVIHGLLHLCGYDDLEPRGRRKMRRREAHYLDELGIRVRRVDERGT